jgi:SAM-dependent methyltransferase
MPHTPTRCLSVVVPCFNEEATLAASVNRVLASPYTAEVIVVDDGSTDSSPEIASDAARADGRVRLLRQPRNLGKGAALRRGFRAATSDYVVVQDADLEYDPQDWQHLLEPLIDGRADVVYGSRFLGSSGAHRVLYFWHAVGNRFLTLTANAFTNLNLTDVETCYKAFRRDVIQGIDLREDRFGFEVEVTRKLARAGCRVYEVPIRYDGRTYEQGKKIGWRDGVNALWCILRYSRVGDRLAGQQGKPPAKSEDVDAELAGTLTALENADAYADWVHTLVADHLGERILEVGAGHGTMTERLAKHGHVTAVESSPRAAALLESRFENEPRVDIVAGAIDKIAEDARFDAAVLINVLEHVDEDTDLLRDLVARLRPGGTVTVFVPAHDWLYSDLDRRLGHCRRYRLSSLAEAMGSAGLSIDLMRYVNSPGALTWLIGARMLGLSPSRRWVHTYQRSVLPAIARVERAREMPFGQSLVAVGRVPAT